MKRVKFLLILFFILITDLIAQTNIPPGYVSGTWTPAGTPYQILGNITVHIDSTLIIEPGVEVIFFGQYKLIVEGHLEAIGTETDSIDFIPADTTNPWGGLELDGSDNELSYCNIRYADSRGVGSFGAISCNSNSLISHCIISDNYGVGAGGITVSGSVSATVSNCIIAGNRATVFGGGIYVNQASLTLSNSLISNNEALFDGGGIYAYYGNVTISGSFFINNTARSGNGGALWFSNCQGSVTDCYFSKNKTIGVTGLGPTIYLGNSSPLISYSIFSDNGQSAGSGGGVYVGTNSNPIIDHCDFFQNGSGGGGGGICVSSSGSMTLKNSIFQTNIFNHIYFMPGCSSTVTYNDFHNPAGFENFIGSIPSGLGQITGVNTNGDSCDVYSNIYMDPLFIDPNSGDFHLQSQSPCIDAGDLASPYDPDSTVTDMGRYFFDQGIPVISISDSLLDFGEVLIGQQNDLPLTISNLGTGILHLQSMINKYSEFSNDWTTADSLILPNDSLTLTVTFTPVDTNLIVDTLLIENNDKQIQVQLYGKGKIVVGIEDQGELPKVYALYPAYPNPFNPETHIRFDLPKSGEVRLIVYDILGRKVTTLVNRKMPAGRYEVAWNAANYTSGLYFYQLTASNFNEVRKMLLVK